LSRPCRPEALAFGTTDELEGLDGPPGQERAQSAIALAARVGSLGHNVYVMGRPGGGRHSAARRVIEAEAAGRPPPDAWCYLNRFDDPRQPRAIRLPPGRADGLKSDMHRLVGELKIALPAAFESEGYRNQRAEIDHEYEERSRAALEALQQEAEQSQLALIQTPQGFAIAPTRKGEILGAEEMEQLPEKERQRARDGVERIGEKLRQHLESLPEWHRERFRRIHELNRDVTASAVGSLIAELRTKYAGLQAVLQYFDQAEADLLEHAAELLHAEQPSGMLAGLEQLGSVARLERYDVNVMVDNAALAGAPVVYESNPTYQNLVGRIENVQQFGALITNFMMVRPGALHRANGGFLLLDAERLLTQPYAWEGLKRALFQRNIRIESLGQILSLIATMSLEPEPIPLEVRVVLVGTRQVYYLLCELDPDFGELFRVVADLDDRVDRTPASEQVYARMIAAMSKRGQLRALDAEAVARLIEYAARLAGDGAKLSTHSRSIEDVVREADHWAAAAGQQVVRAADVDRALQEQLRRLNRIHMEVQDAIRRHSLLIDCTGEAIGQVNGLSVFRLGPRDFGQPVRITATVRVGDGKVVDIEREVELGGAIHSKGVLILAGLIGARYGTGEPLSLQASLVFEQTYSGVEGDSASLAEACALLSALAEAPMRQDLGVTGSINQHGLVQSIGAVNEKIEGFFDVCQAGGLTGSQGVVVPADNEQNLMLRPDLVEAVGAGRFHVHVVRTVDDAISLLTSSVAGSRDASGGFPTGSLNARVDERLQAFARLRRRFARESGDEKSRAGRESGS
jgi:lon-related putative ATP-dependent protease